MSDSRNANCIKQKSATELKDPNQNTNLFSQNTNLFCLPNQLLIHQICPFLNLKDIKSNLGLVSHYSQNISDAYLTSNKGIDAIVKNTLDSMIQKLIVQNQQSQLLYNGEMTTHTKRSFSRFL